MNRSQRKPEMGIQSTLFTSWSSVQSTPTNGGPDRSVLPDNEHEDSRRLLVGDKLFSESSWDVLFVTIVSVTETEALSDRGYRFYRNFNDGDSHINGELSPTWDFIHWVVVP